MSSLQKASARSGTRPHSSTLSPRKRAVLRAATALFREHGYHGTSIRDIGAAAGVTSAALYRHFANKDEVLETAIWMLGDEFDAATREALGSERGEPRAVLEALVRAFVRVGLEQRDLGAVYLFEARHLKPEVYADMRRNELRQRDLWAHYLRLARPELSETRARTMARAAFLMVCYVCLEDAEIEPQQLGGLVADMALQAMLQGATAPETHSRRESSR